jgi:hypothetical protein
MGNLRKTVFLKDGLNRLFRNEQEYMKNLIRDLLSIQNSGNAPIPQAPQNDARPENREGERGEI